MSSPRSFYSPSRQPSMIPGLKYSSTLTSNLYRGKMHPYLEQLFMLSLQNPDMKHPSMVSRRRIQTLRLLLEEPSESFDPEERGILADEAIPAINDFLVNLPYPLIMDVTVKRSRLRATARDRLKVDHNDPVLEAKVGKAEYLMVKYILAYIRVVSSFPEEPVYHDPMVVDVWLDYFHPAFFGDLVNPADEDQLITAMEEAVEEPSTLTWLQTTSVRTPSPVSPISSYEETPPDEGISELPQSPRQSPLCVMVPQSAQMTYAGERIAVQPSGDTEMQGNGIFIHGGTVVNSDGMFPADVFIRNETIQYVGKGGFTIPPNCCMIDATNKYVIPGGIDPHTHFQLPFMGTCSIDDFYQGTVAALAGGTTMIIDFALGPKGQSLIDSYKQWRSWADPKVCCDYALHVCVTWWDSKVEEEMEELVRNYGVNSFKMFMAYKDVFMLTDSELCETFRRCRELGSVAMVHAENGSVIDMNQKNLLAAGITGPEGHEQSRPEEVEAEAVHRAVVMASQINCPLYVVHVMSKSAAQEIANGRQKDVVLFGETLACALATDGRNYYNKCWSHAAAHVLSPPVNIDPSTPAYLIDQLVNGNLQVVGSDNCTFSNQQKSLGKDDFTKIPNGVNGVEDRMSITWEKIVHSGKLSPTEFVAITSSNAAKIFNLFPQKGHIAVDSDADVVIWDPNRERVISTKTDHHANDFNVFEGMKCHGVPVKVISRGRVVVNDGEILAVRGRGQFIFCKPCGDYIYQPVQEIEKNRTYKKVERSPYSSPVTSPKDQSTSRHSNNSSYTGSCSSSPPIS